MPLDDIALEELGLAPRWVRKGAQGARADADRQAVADAQPVVAATPSADAEDGMRRAVAAPPVARREPKRDGLPPDPATRRASDDALESRDDEAAATGTTAREAGARPTPRPQPISAAPPAAAPIASTPSIPEPPPDDDFAWFDATPASAPEPAPFADDVAAPVVARGDVATLDWDALAERVASCTACRLCERRTNTVFGVGDRAAEWMLIGEAPGENEDRQGEPFVGQAGKLLDNMLRALSLARGENVYIANVIKCRPPGNRNPEPDEVARCEPYLQRQVQLVKPKIIVALGRFAAQSLLKSTGSIASLRGRVHEYEGVPVIVTYHPAYLLRSLHDKSKAWADLCLARETWRAASGHGG